MSAAAREPERRWFLPAVAGAALVAIVCGYGCYSVAEKSHGIAALGQTEREELAALPITPRATAAVERKWLSDSKNEYLIASMIPMPCANVESLVTPSERGAVHDAIVASNDPDPVSRIERLETIADSAPDNLTVALIQGSQLIVNGELARAEQTLRRALDRTDKDERIITASKSEGKTVDLNSHEVSTVIHLHHALGVARLAHGSENAPWLSLKNVIGSVKTLSSRRLAGATRNQPVWSRLLIAAPGCSSTSSSLSTYDLYNNLIVAYMSGNFTGAPSEREKEFGQRNDANPLQAVLDAQLKRAESTNWANESQLWALSNVRQVIDWRLPDVPDDARLAFNSVQVIDWWTKGKGEGIPELRDKLIEQAFRRHNVAADQHATFARDVLRMLATSGVNRTSIAADAAEVRQWLTPADARVLDNLLAADAARNAFSRWIALPEEDQDPPYEKLDAHAGAWSSAALTDFAASASRWIAGRTPDEQRKPLIAIRKVLGSAEAPPELVELESKRELWDRLYIRASASPWSSVVKGAGLAFFIWLAITWVLLHIRERRLLRTSFYNIEYETLTTGDVHRSGRMR